MGRWNQTGTERNTWNCLDYRQSTLPKDAIDKSVIVMRRKYQNFSDPSLHRVVITLQNDENDIKDYFLVQYYFQGNEKNIEILPHGNAKHNESSYMRTSQSTKDRIAELCKSNNPAPKRIMHQIIEDQGGLERVHGASSMPRNRQQVSNIKRNVHSKKETDSLVELVDLAKQQERGENKFVRDVRAAPEFTMMLCTNGQLSDLRKFCTNTGKFCVAGIDTTFNIGEYYVTIITYRHLMLQTVNGKEPVMIGPVLLHQKKSFDSYFKLSSGLVQECKELLNLKVFGSDGDVNLSDAFLASFPGVKHLLCDMHMVDNVERQLKKLGISGQTAKEFIRDIFGLTEGNVRMKGLVDAMSSEDFDLKLSELKEVWFGRHCHGREFYSYFLEYKADLIKNSMTAEIRSECGLGYPPQLYTQNANECINSILKTDIANEIGTKKKLDPYQFAKLLEKFIKRQETEIKMALIGKGELRLRKEYQHLFVDEATYWRKSTSQRETVFKKFQQEPLKTDKDSLSNDTEDIESRSTSDLNLPTRPENSNITNVPFAILRNMFSEAEKVLREKNNIVLQPGSDNIYIVANLRKPAEPYSVKFTASTTAAICSKKCHRYSSFKVCEHTLATAYYVGVFDVYLKSYRKKNMNTCNLTNMSNTNMPANRGKKASKATERRKGASHKPDIEITDYADIADEREYQQQQVSTEQPFHLTFCAGLIKKCYGCNQEFSAKNRKPPNDLLLKRFDHRVYISPRSKTRRKTATLQSTYFHLGTECARRVAPAFELQDIIIHNEIKKQLCDGHIFQLRKAGLFVERLLND